MTIPTSVRLFIAGMPATGKSYFGAHLEAAHAFKNVDMESMCKDLHSIWQEPHPVGVSARTIANFMRAVAQHGGRIVLTWGFPPSWIWAVNELRYNHGFDVVWFAANEARSRESYILRAHSGGEPLDMPRFENQVFAIKHAGYPATLACRQIETLMGGGRKLPVSVIEQRLFG